MPSCLAPNSPEVKSFLQLQTKDQSKPESFDRGANVISGEFSTHENSHPRSSSLMPPLPTSSPWLKTSCRDIAGSALDASTAQRVQDSPPSEGQETQGCMRWVVKVHRAGNGKGFPFLHTTFSHPNLSGPMKSFKNTEGGSNVIVSTSELGISQLCVSSPFLGTGCHSLL
ncbi:hypothetical protein LEMLEM_LOCUS20194, partial [Lemmus lemmus]